MTSRHSAMAEKRDLHVGGVGASGTAALSTIIEPATDPIRDAAEPLVRKAREVLQGADDYVHDNPWAVLGAVALAGLAAGYVLSRRF